MCYGMGCKYENHMGECRKPYKEICPLDLVECEGCHELFEEKDMVDVVYIQDNLPTIVCKDCAADEDIYKELT